MKIHMLRPALSFKVWGGQKLRQIKTPQMSGKLDTSGDPLGETWEVSRHPDGQSITSAGHKLGDIFSHEQLPYLIKFIDTSDNLSIQVHPTTDYANNVGEESKTECWLILSAEEGAGIYLGFDKEVSKESLKSSIENGDDISKDLKFYKVSPGDFFYIPAGSIHAIGKGITLLEVQQSSDTTYRVWDWNRLGLNGKLRELHVDKALDVINFEKEKNSKEFFNILSDVFEKDEVDLITHEDFNVKSLNMKAGQEYSLKRNSRATSVVALKNKVSVKGHELKEYNSCIIESGEDITIKSLEDSVVLIVT